MIPGGVELLVIVAIVGLLVAAPKVLPRLARNSVTAATETRAEVEAALSDRDEQLVEEGLDAEAERPAGGAAGEVDAER